MTRKRIVLVTALITAVLASTMIEGVISYWPVRVVVLLVIGMLIGLTAAWSTGERA